MQNEYYLGLDIGTDSVGWAVTDTNYKIPKFRGNAMWGIRLFDESSTAEERRAFRTARRRTQRKRERLELLEMLFNAEISQKDISFFQRLKESNLYREDKSVQCKYAVFADNDYTDKEFHKEFPTVYHLRRELIHNPAAHDVRLVFIALHHIIKSRGHFLFDSLEETEINNFSLIYNELTNYLKDNYDIQLECADVDKFSGILKDKTMSKTKKNSEISALFGITKKAQEYSILSLLSGSSVKLCDIFNDDSLKEAERKSITFASGFDDTAPEYESILGERFELIEKLKAIYDWAVLEEILKGKKYLSDAKVEVYEQHKADLKELKKYVKAHLPEKYNAVFKASKSGIDNYVAYSHHIKEQSRTGILNDTCTQEAFCTYLKKLLGECKDEAYAEMFAKIENGTFMPKQVNKDNGVIPMQIHRKELIKILNNAKEYLPFLNSADESGKTVCDKILALFDYRIPYYVGPLNPKSPNSWLVRSNQKIYPWNIEDVVDFDKSAERFIEKLTSKCTYLPREDVIPKNSMLYSKFMVLNELNNLKIDGETIDVQLKQDIYNNIFMRFNKVTAKRLSDYLHSIGYEFESITGINGNFKTSLKSAIDLKTFDLSVEDKEEIIKAITIFGADKKLLKKRLSSEFSDKLKKDELSKILRLKYSDWSNLSKKFLTGIECVDKESGELVNIITALWQTNDNLMQLYYSDRYEPKFCDAVKALNSLEPDKSMRQIVEELYVSPKVKRPIYQSLLILKEIEKIEKCPPKKIFIEVARGDEKKEPKASRKDRLIELYKNCKKDNEELYLGLLDKEEDALRSDKLYLYYTQMGKCMYTGENIELDELMGSNSRWDIDHIFPRSKIKDDSLNNRVLVKKTVNSSKTNDYPISGSIQAQMGSFWNMLLSKKLISNEKHQRLVRKEALRDDELKAFISRQLVETRQSTKAVANILEQLYPHSEIVYVKAALASDFRKDRDMLKCREVNDFHHAKDAYLNIVVGNVYTVKFSHFSHNYSLNRMFDFNIKGAWTADNDQSLNIVKNTMAKNNIRYTRYAFEKQGGFYKQTIRKKGQAQVPVKNKGAVTDKEKYGGYSELSSTYFCCAEHGKPNNRIRSLFAVELIYKNKYEQNPTAFLKERYNLINPEIIVQKIKTQACISFDNFRTHLGGKDSGGKVVAYRPAIQLVLSYNDTKYIRNIAKYLSESSKREINKFDNITKEDNQQLYLQLTEKLRNKIFNVMFSDLQKKLADAYDKFTNLAIADQCYIIAEILKILHNNAMSGNLKLIGISSNGRIRLNNNISKISKFSSVKLINQSVTGLFEQEIELLK